MSLSIMKNQSIVVRLENVCVFVDFSFVKRSQLIEAEKSLFEKMSQYTKAEKIVFDVWIDLSFKFIIVSKV